MKYKHSIYYVHCYDMTIQYRNLLIILFFYMALTYMQMKIKFQMQLKRSLLSFAEFCLNMSENSTDMHIFGVSVFEYPQTSNRVRILNLLSSLIKN